MNSDGVSTARLGPYYGELQGVEVRLMHLDLTYAYTTFYEDRAIAFLCGCLIADNPVLKGIDPDLLACIATGLFSTYSPPNIKRLLAAH